MQELATRRGSRLFCPLKNDSSEIFVSLVDYRNNLFTSKDPEKIIEFYNGFDNKSELIQWMNERPKGVTTIYEVEGDKNIIVVITTADYNGKYAKECRDNIFKGLHIVFVESGGREDNYFNFAHNINTGIRKAMEYNPKWVVVSNDDMVIIDSSSTLKNQLMEIDNNNYRVLFTRPSYYHSIPCYLSRQRITRKILFYLLGRPRRKQFLLEKRFGVEFFLPPSHGYWKFFFKKGISILSIATFGIFSPELIREFKNLYDETYINSAEDMDLSVRIAFKKIPASIIGYRIGNLKGSTLGRDVNRHLREIAGLYYFNLNLMEKQWNK